MNFASDYNRLKNYSLMINDDIVGCISIKTKWWKFKLGASPQLEWWNTGILEKWVLGYCNIG